MNRIATVTTVFISIALTATAALAQAPRLMVTDTPKAEVGAIAGLWSLDQFGETGFGGRLTLNQTGWIGAELSLDGKPDDENTPSQRVMIVNARLMTRLRARPAFLFATAGGAITSGLDRNLSPMIGAGIQSLWQGGFVALRAEIQHFPGGAIHFGSHSRLMLGLVVAIR